MAQRRVQTGDQLVSELEKKEVLAGKSHNCSQVHSIRFDNLVDERERLMYMEHRTSIKEATVLH